MVRTQLYLDSDTHRRLRDLARRQGRTVSDLVRDAVARTYGTALEEERLSTLEGIAGLWQDLERELGSTDVYVRRQRRDTHRNRSRA